jgi:hypothetical protein
MDAATRFRRFKRARGRGSRTAVLMVAGLLVVSCGGGSDRHADATATSASTSTTAAVDVPATQAMKAWQDYLSASAEWVNPPNPADPRIPQLVAASAVDKVREKVAIEKAKRIGTRAGPGGPSKHAPTVRSSEPTQVVIRDCFVDDSVGYDVRTGDVVDDGVTTLTIEARLVPEAGTWKIKEIREVSKVEGRATCAG